MPSLKIKTWRPLKYVKPISKKKKPSSPKKIDKGIPKVKLECTYHGWILMPDDKAAEMDITNVQKLSTIAKKIASSQLQVRPDGTSSIVTISKKGLKVSKVVSKKKNPLFSADSKSLIASIKCGDTVVIFAHTVGNNGKKGLSCDVIQCKGSIEYFALSFTRLLSNLQNNIQYFEFNGIHNPDPYADNLSTDTASDSSLDLNSSIESIDNLGYLDVGGSDLGFDEDDDFTGNRRSSNAHPADHDYFTFEAWGESVSQEQKLVQTRK